MIGVQSLLPVHWLLLVVTGLCFGSAASEGLCWTSWINRDNPSGTGDFETLSLLKLSNREVCSKPQGISCRTKTEKVDSKDTGQKVTCNLQTGLVCLNEEQKGLCFDYEVRFLCPCRKRQKWGGTIDARVAPNGYASYDGAVRNKAVQCQWLIRARDGERIKLHAVYRSPRKGSRCHVYNGKRSDVSPVWSKTRSYSESVFLLSTGSTLLMRCFVPLRFARSTSIRVWYRVVKKPVSWKECDFEQDTCPWDVGKSNWERVSCADEERNGIGYRGTMSFTESGHACQWWYAQFPHKHSFSNADRYPELKKAQNHCRNPGNLLSGPWCYTTDRSTVRELCPVGERVCKGKRSSFLALVKKPASPTAVSTGPITIIESSGTALVSPLFAPIKFKCLRFDYVLKPNATGNEAIKVFFLDVKGNSLTITTFLGTGTHDWREAFVKIPHDVEVYVKIEAIGLRADNWKTGDVAIDNVTISTCSKKLTCSFGEETCVVQRDAGSGAWSLNDTISSISPEPVFSFHLSRKSSRRPSLSFVVTPDDRLTTDQCIMLTYKTSFANSSATVTDVAKAAKRSRVAWQTCGRLDVSWRTILFPLSDTPWEANELMARKVRIYPYDDDDDVETSEGFFDVRSLRTIFPCGKVRNCTSFSYSDVVCGWETTSVAPRNSFSWSIADRNQLSFASSLLSADNRIVYVQSPPIGKEGYNCFAVQYRVYPPTFQRYADSYRFQLIVNGEIYVNRRLQSVSVSRDWHMDVMDIPDFGESGNVVQVRFELCVKCGIRFRSFVFAEQHCRTPTGELNDIHECSVASLNKCSDVCTNTFGGYECSCSDYRYVLSSDNHTCTPRCSSPCKNGGKCVAFNRCSCPDGYTHDDCSVMCPPVELINGTGQIDFRPPFRSYYTDLFCSWTIEAPPGKNVAFEVSRLTSRGYWCDRYVKVEISGGRLNGSSNDARTISICGDQPSNHRVVSIGNRLTVSFLHVKDQYFNNLLFQANYRITDNDVCVARCSDAQWWQTCCHKFLIALPNVLRQGVTADIHIATQGMRKLSNFQARLLRDGNVTLTAGAFTQLVDGYGSVSFEIPETFLSGKYRLEIDGVAADDMSRLSGVAEVGVAAKGPSVLVQTEKPVYKPGQLVRMRLVVLDFNMKPYSKNISVEIADGKGTKVLQWLNLLPTNGVLNLSFPLSSQPVAGTWKIAVYTDYPEFINPVLVQETCFTVLEYVLPKFQVNLLLPEYLVDGDIELSGAISARYTYGKPVKGLACLYFTTLHQFLSPSTAKTHCVQIDGLSDFSMKMYDLSPYYKYSSFRYIPHSVEVNVSVTEQGTGAVVNESQIIAIARSPYAIQFDPGTPTYYKPGLPFIATISIVTPDFRPFLNTTELSVRLVGDGQFLTSFSVESINGSVQLDVFHNGNKYYDRMVISASFSVGEKTVSASYTVKPRKSANDDDFLSLMSHEPILQPGEETTISVFTNNPVSADLHLLAIGRGKIHHSWKVPMQSDSSRLYSGVYQFEFPFNATCSLSPNFFLVAYYIAANVGVGDVVKLQVARCFEHKVSVNFSTNVTRPGENVQLFIKAAPNSHVSLTAVDKSVYLVPSLCTGNQMTAQNVLLEMQKFDTSYRPPAVSSVSDDELISDDEDGFDGSGGSGGGFQPGAHLSWWKPWWSAIDSPYIFKDPGIVVITNVKFDSKKDVHYVKRQAGSADDGDEDLGENGISPGGRTRSYFPEAWLWDDYETNDDGEVVVNATVPDTITTWIADAFALSSSAGFGAATAPSRLVAFKPFFVSLRLPYSVIRGEEVAILATVFNYFYENLTVTVALDMQTTDGFEFAGNSSEIELFVRAQDSRTIRFPIVPKRLGRIPLRVSAHSALEFDAVLRMLLVEPEGKEESYFMSVFMSGEQTETFSLSLPEHIVHGSSRGYITISGDSMGPAINSLGSLLKMPYGCGEQNMINFAPAVMVKRYLTSVEMLTPAIDRTATRYTQMGYQRQLTYKRNDDSYAVWGQSSSSGSICLTTYVLRVFAQASSIMYLDEADLIRTACWVMRMQQLDGSFREPGRCFHRDLLGFKGDEETVRTAYSLISLVEVNGIKPIQCYGAKSLSEVISKTVRFLTSKSATLTSDYSRAIVAYALSVADETDAAASVLLQKLEESARVQGSKKHWSLGSKHCHSSRHHCPSPPGAIETTAYVLLAYVARGDIVSALPIRNWLISQMNGNGGWRSTQDSVLALMALSLLSIKLGVASEQDVKVEMTANDGTNASFIVNDANRLITQHFEVSLPNHLRFESSGKGAAIVQASVSYNVPEVAPESSFEINVEVTNKWIQEAPTVVTPSATTSPPLITSFPTTDSPSTAPVSTPTLQIDDNGLELSTCVKWARRDVNSGMAIVEIGFLSGFNIDQANLRSLVHDNDISIQRFEVDGRKAIFYFDELESGRNICFNSSFTRSYCVANLQPAFIQAYSYYEPDYLTDATYGPPSTISNTLNACQSPAEEIELDNDSEDVPPSQQTFSGDDESFIDAM